MLLQLPKTENVSNIKSNSGQALVYDICIGRNDPPPTLYTKLSRAAGPFVCSFCSPVRRHRLLRSRDNISIVLLSRRRCRLMARANYFRFVPDGFFSAQLLEPLLFLLPPPRCFYPAAVRFKSNGIMIVIS